MGGEYTVKVAHEGEPFPTETITFKSPADVMAAIPDLLKKHPGCHRIHVHAGQAHLFSVDCSGETVRD